MKYYTHQCNALVYQLFCDRWWSVWCPVKIVRVVIPRRVVELCCTKAPYGKESKTGEIVLVNSCLMNGTTGHQLHTRPKASDAMWQVTKIYSSNIWFSVFRSLLLLMGVPKGPNHETVGWQRNLNSALRLDDWEHIVSTVFSSYNTSTRSLFWLIYLTFSSFRSTGFPRLLHGG